MYTITKGGILRHRMVSTGNGTLEIRVSDAPYDPEADIVATELGAWDKVREALGSGDWVRVDGDVIWKYFVSDKRTGTVRIAASIIKNMGHHLYNKGTSAMTVDWIAIRINKRK
jgi:hypothetical protein